MSENVLVRRETGADGKLAYSVTDAGLAQVERLAAEGCSDATIAQCLGINRKDFSHLLRETDGDPRVLEAFYRGKGKLADECIGTLLGHMRSGNVTACIFACKSLLGMRDQGPATPAVGSAVQVNITIPPAMSDAEFAKIIEVKQNE